MVRSGVLRMWLPPRIHAFIESRRFPVCLGPFPRVVQAFAVSTWAAGLAMPLAAGNPVDSPGTLTTVEVRPAAGPHIRRFVRGNNELLVLGTIRPVPRDFGPDFPPVDQAVAAAGVVLGSPGVIVDAQASLVRKALLWPKIRQMRRLDGTSTLQGAVGEQLHRRWSALVTRWPLPAHVERLRPMYAAQALYEEALSKEGLSSGSLVSAQVQRAARRHGRPVMDVRVQLNIRDAAAALDAFSIGRDDDIGCFAQVVDGLEFIVANARRAARDWASGRFGDISGVTSKWPGCWSRLTNQAIARAVDVELAPAMRDAWLLGLRQATEQHRVVFLTMPLEDLLDCSGLFAALVDEGFEPVSQPPGTRCVATGG